MPSGASQGALKELADRFGSDFVTPPDAIAERYLADWSNDHHGLARALVRPRRTEDVSAFLRWAHENRVPVTVQGGHTGLVGAACANGDHQEIIISLERMKSVRSIDPVGASVIVEAGCILAELKDAVEAEDFFFPLTLGAQGTCQIGGNVGTNAGGVNVVRYGMMRDLVLGLEVVLADGQIVRDLSGLRKKNTGYDWKQLFIGGEGTLGIVTAACLKLFPKPRQVETLWLASHSVADIMRIFARLRGRCAEFLSAFELITGRSVAFARTHYPDLPDIFREAYPHYALVELSMSGGPPLRPWLEDELSDMLEAGIIANGAVAESESQAKAFWQMREATVEAQSLRGKHLRTDVSVPISAIERFLSEADALCARTAPEGEVIAYGHVGDGNIHLNVVRRREAPEAEFLERLGPLEAAINEIVDRLDGSISAEHGIGVAKRASFERRVAEAELSLMRSIKTALDPNGILNPDRIFWLNGTSDRGHGH